MARSAIVRALRFQNLLNSIGRDLAISETGVSAQTFDNLLLLLQLPQSVQDLIDQGLLFADVRICRKLLQLPAGKVEQIARHLVDAGLDLRESIGAVENAVAGRALSTQLSPDQALIEAGLIDPVAAALALDSETVILPRIRQLARSMCIPCAVRHTVLDDFIEEPALQLLIKAAQTVCSDCEIQLIERACSACPGVAMLKYVIENNKPKPTTTGV